MKLVTSVILTALIIITAPYNYLIMFSFEKYAIISVMFYENYSSLGPGYQFLNFQSYNYCILSLPQTVAG